MLFGWLGDKVGRVRAMTVSVLLYSLCSGASAASQTAEQLAVLRFIGALGMGGEWALGVALVMELWPNASRAWLAGWIGAFGNFGYLICGGIALGLNHTAPGQLQSWLSGTGLPDDFAAALTANRNWRLLMFVGTVPALLTLLVRLFVPESEKWTKEKEAGKASHWSERDLIGVLPSPRSRRWVSSSSGRLRRRSSTPGSAYSARPSGWRWSCSVTCTRPADTSPGAACP